MTIPALIIGGSGTKKSTRMAIAGCTDMKTVGATQNQTCVLTMATAASVGQGGATGYGANAISEILWSYSAAPTGGRLTLDNGTIVFLDLDITTAGYGEIRFDPPICGPSPGDPVNITLYPASGATGKLNAHGWVEY